MTIAVDLGPQAGRVYQALRGRITSGEFPASARLPANARLANEYNVALMTVRQAIARLERDGLVASEHGRGTFVRDRRTDTTRRETFTLFRSAVDDAPIAMATLDAAGRVRSWNGACEALYGWPEDEVLGNPSPDVPLDGWDELRGYMARALAGERLTDVECRRIRRDGREIVASVSISPLRDAEGYVNGVIVMAADVTGRRQIEGMRAHLAWMVESTADTIIGQTLDGIITSWNPAAERMYGWTAEEIIGQPVDIIVPPERRHELPDIRARLRRGETIRLHESVDMHRDGHRIDISLTISPLFDERGQAAAAVAITRDISESKRMQQQLRANEERFRLQYQFNPVPMFTWQRRDDDWVLIEFNEAAARIMGSTSGHLGISARHVYADRPDIMADFVRCAAEQDVIEREMPYTTLATGEQKTLRVRYIFLPPDLILVHTEDITVYREAQAELERGLECEAQARSEVEDMHRGLAAAIEASPLPAVILDPAGRIQVWNRAGEQLYGWAAEDILGQYPPNLPAEELSSYLDDVAALAEASGPVERRVSRRTRAGTWLDVTVSLSAARDAQGRVQGLIGWVVDSRPREDTASWQGRPSTGHEP